ncbi:beta-N-acetylhexosaminidase [Flavivirga spongiicola]|uniref:Beta-N-acetylhexosaminidase n=1 Tax=Flavivirga spongiicola TaxID=421621 RepID=A0ABU7XRL1_9FLAO|nr:family 20 glycosylhydrolase [Flavivirga sp. MEBiC05379]MDO5978103.1 family 20 glycosylhydrolase [Flavivirga sp. MEBiC05379]
MKIIRRSIIIYILIISHFCVNAQTKLSEKYNLMPWPEEVVDNDQKFSIDENFTIAVNKDKINDRLFNATTKFLRRLSGRTGVFIDKGFALTANQIKKASLRINYEREGELELHENESYQLTVLSSQIILTAKTDIGILRGLETLLQLSANTKTEYFFHGVTIKDSPRFTWRGLMIDVARHYQPLNVLKRNLDAMAAVKMNVFHWHLCDDQGFRVEVKALPKLHQLGSDGQYYTHNQIKEIVNYASNLGIRVVPEFDVPGHASAILTAYPEIGSKDITYKIERRAGVFDPTLDPTNDKTYQVIDALFSEISQLFPDKYFHIGGDENKGKHWDENIKIQNFKKKKGFKTNHELQTYFNIKIQDILKKNNRTMMGWDEIFQPNLPKDVVIHSWRGNEAMLKSAKLGYKTILSKGYYIDLLESIKTHYSTEPIPNNHDLSEDQVKNILGGEATMWGELVTPVSIDSRIWPRTAAIAERFWSVKSVNNIDNMLKRLESVSFKLEELGITHIRNRDVILRNISNNQDITSLIVLSKICEPLKAYERKKGGTIYKSFSPFTRFINACTPDALDAISFNKKVDSFIVNSNDQSYKDDLVYFFDKWVSNNEAFIKINNNPMLNQLAPLSKNLADLSILLKKGMSQKLNKEEFKIVSKYMNNLNKPFSDTELAIIDGLNKIISTLK